MEQNSRKKSALIFLNGSYPDEHIDFYSDSIKSRDEDREVGREPRVPDNESVLIAVDGGLNLFDKLGAEPDIIIGDFDSANPELVGKFSGSEKIKIDSANKMFTDGEFALKQCVERGVGRIVIYGGIDISFETDHLLGNVFLLFAYKRQFESIIMRDYCQEIIPLENETYEGAGKPGDFISIVPLSDEIRFESAGLKYPSGGQTFEFGGTTPLRNELSENEFKIDLTGRALLVRHY